MSNVKWLIAVASLLSSAPILAVDAEFGRLFTTPEQRRATAEISIEQSATAVHNKMPVTPQLRAQHIDFAGVIEIEERVSSVWLYGGAAKSVGRQLPTRGVDGLYQWHMRGTQLQLKPGQSYFFNNKLSRENYGQRP